MKYEHIHALFWLIVFHTSCGQNQAPSNENIRSETKAIDASSGAEDPNFHTEYEYTDSAGNYLTIQNGFPRGGSKYTDPGGEVYGYAVFWTRIINETDKSLELQLDFSDSYQVPSLPGKYFKLMVLPDTMTLDKISLFNYGLVDLESFLDDNIHKPSGLKRIINAKESSAFYVLKLTLVSDGTSGGGDILRTGLVLKGQDLFYRVSVYNSIAPPSVMSEKEIDCGSINLKNLILKK
ncbi:MAG: hypothetical protein KDC80_11950 [Saprospiraceae bacterium]|nr:hypothetical protein [Saprospiraceae bacterium]